MASASSRMTSLKPFLKKKGEKGMGLVLAVAWCWRNGSVGCYSQPDPHGCFRGTLLNLHPHPPSSSLLIGHPWLLPTCSHPKPTSQAKRRGRLCCWGGDDGMGNSGKLWEAQTHHLLKDGPGACKAQDGPSDDVNTPVIRGVELEGGGSMDPYPFPRMLPGVAGPRYPIPFPLTSNTMEPNSRSR